MTFTNRPAIAFLMLVLFAMLGFGFWFTLFALVAATINDPNSSSRSSLMFLLSVGSRSAST